MNNTHVMLNNNCRLGDLLHHNLQIPNYQRGYCWEEKQIKPFLEALWFANKTIPYHLGTIIVHEHLDRDCNVCWDVVDGQQRLITLSILQYCLCQKGKTVISQCTVDDCRCSSSLLQCVTSDLDMLWHVHEAANIVKEWINDHPINWEELKGFVFGTPAENSSQADTGVCVSVVRIQEPQDAEDQNRYLPLAWTFFNALNSGGKRLSDYDLLKAHHLRHLTQTGTDELTIRFKASRWDFLGEQKIPSLFGNNDGLYETSFANTFYLIRTWLRNRHVNISWMPADGQYCILNHYSALSSLALDGQCELRRITDGIAGGMLFFDWAEYWLWQYQQFCDNPIIKRFLMVPWKAQQLHLLIIVRAVLFYYYCRFGNHYLADACIFILYRIGKLRNTRQRLNAWYGNEGKYVPHTIEALDESPSPAHFFHYCKMPSNRYAPKYNLKNTVSEMEQSDRERLLSSGNHGPDWWKRFLGFAASTITNEVTDPYLKMSGRIGSSICRKNDVKKLLNDVAHDFGWEYDDSLNLGFLKTEDKNA